jgi:predicted Zn-dependent protease with MMP-like domain
MSKLNDMVDAARTALLEERFDEAQRCLEQARRIDAKHVSVALLEIEVLDAQGMEEEAVSAAEEALENTPHSMVLRFTLAQLILDIYDDVKEARPHLEKLAHRLHKGEAPDIMEDDAELRATVQKEFATELWLSLADVRAADHDPHGALEAASRAVDHAPDDAIARTTKAACVFDLCRLDEADALIAQALTTDARCADALWLRGRVLTVRGQHDEADKCFSHASKLDGDRFGTPYRLSEDEFAEHLARAHDELPEQLRVHMKNVDVIVQDLPDLDVMRKAELPPSALGLFDPEPLAPNVGGPQQPIRIFLFRKNLEVACSSEEEMIDEISLTLLHELGHYFGLDEDDLDERGLN